MLTIESIIKTATEIPHIHLDFGHHFISPRVSGVLAPVLEHFDP